jgi:hypothetical protein
VRKIPAVLFVLFFVFLSFCFAQSNYTESLTITTYYPAPYGVYRHLRLNPTDDFTPGAACVYEGELGYSKNSHKLYICNGTPPNLIWNILGDGYWAQAGANSIYSASAGNVGIGTNNPTEKLQVSGAVNATGGVIVGTTAPAINGSIRFIGTGFEGYYDNKWNALSGVSAPVTPVTPSPPLTTIFCDDTDAACLGRCVNILSYYWPAQTITGTCGGGMIFNCCNSCTTNAMWSPTAPDAGYRGCMSVNPYTSTCVPTYHTRTQCQGRQ